MDGGEGCWARVLIWGLLLRWKGVHARDSGGLRFPNRGHNGSGDGCWWSEVVWDLETKNRACFLQIKPNACTLWARGSSGEPTFFFLAALLRVGGSFQPFWGPKAEQNRSSQFRFQNLPTSRTSERFMPGGPQIHSQNVQHRPVMVYHNTLIASRFLITATVGLGLGICFLQASMNTRKQSMSWTTNVKDELKPEWGSGSFHWPTLLTMQMQSKPIAYFQPLLDHYIYKYFKISD